MDNYRAAAANFLTVIPASFPHRHSRQFPAPVIPAKAGIQRVADAVGTPRAPNVNAPQASRV